MKKRFIILVTSSLTLTNLKVIIDFFMSYSHWIGGMLSVAFILIYFFHLSILLYKLVRLMNILPTKEDYIGFNHSIVAPIILLFILLFIYVISSLTYDNTLLIILNPFIILTHDRLYQFIFIKDKKIYYYDDKEDVVHNIVAYEINKRELKLKLEKGRFINIRLSNREKTSKKIAVLENWMKLI